ADAGLPRDVERQGRRRDGCDDHEPARVRGELEGNPDGRRDVDDREQPPAMSSGRLLIALVLALPGVGEAFSGVTVRVAPDAVVARDVVTVGDIATVEGDEPLASRIRQVRFSPAPPPGGRHRLDAAAIRARLRTATLDPARVRVDVPETLVITRAFQVIPGEALVEAVRREARTRLPGAGEDLALLPIGRADDRRAPTGDV